ncbi:Aste57867_6533 [Aphanomyces stellatus]|nr:hypothetical protein As57867_006516 [Aphanomyces stellatus]KAF0711164.1 hypothetical protein As57867_005354 [Aphanomyces stellatus]VFT82426.1 Aste57867_5367 [Aphanomyces stellatus]VFT83515.1 Aste57867_6533 [Aphanomyces stellatus]
MIGDYGRSMKDALLVVVPSHASVVIPEIEQSTVTKGPVIELTSAGILEFLESQMNDITKFNALRHFLPEKDRKIKLSGRDVALQRAAECMKNLSKPVYQTSKPDRSIPVCCGLPGLGKSRMLDEWQKIFELADIKGPQLGAFVIYYNGHKPQPIEASMTIEASFSWRLLHRLFLEGNGPEFGKWFSENLPKNCGKLQLQITLEVVRDKAIQMGISTPEDTLQMFLGIDEYQSIKDVNGIRVTTNQDGTKQELLQDLIDVLGHVLSSPVNAIRIFPMFAGTDLSVISIANSSKTECFRLPMLLLTPREVESAVSSIVNGPLLLLHALVRRHLFYLGGVPRWVFEYIHLLLNLIPKDGIPKVGTTSLAIEEIEPAYFTIKDKYIESWGKGLEEIDLILLAAYSIAGVSVDPFTKVVGKMTWSRVRDSSLCLLTEKSEVLIPYSMFHRIARFNPQNYVNAAEKCFIVCIQGLIEKVDGRIYDKPQWSLWEDFGAYFHALRINAVIIIGKPVIKVSELFMGALVSGCNEQVQLSPTKVMEYDEKFGSSIEAEIGRKWNSLEKFNWLTGGFVVINGENGRGVDIFFALKKRDSNGYVVCLDQRNRVADTSLGSVGTMKLLSSAKIEPTNLGALYEPITVIPLLFSSLRPVNVQELAEKNAVVVSYSQMEAYHHGLWLHPASSPCVNVNKDPVTYIKMVLTGNTSDVDIVATHIGANKKRKYESIEEFGAAMEEISPNVKLTNQERIVFC